MQVIEIKTPELPNELINDTINLILKSDKIDGVAYSELSRKGMSIGDLMTFGISDKNILNGIMENLKSNGFYTDNKDLSWVDKELLNKPEIDADLAVRIQSIYNGIVLKKESYLKYFDRPENIYLPSLKVEIDKNWVKCNLDEIIYEVNGGTIIRLKNSILEQPRENQCNGFKKAITAMAEISIDYDTDDFKKHVERLTFLKENIPDGANLNGAEPHELNPHPRYFISVNAFKLFESFRETIVNELADYSFIYRQMVADGLMYDIKDMEYRNWLGKNYKIAIDKTKQLGGCKTKTKMGTYKMLFDLYKPY